MKKKLLALSLVLAMLSACASTPFGQHRGNTHTHRSTRTRSRTHPGADIHPVSGTRADNGRIR